ncbi:MAG TPA: sigma factor-like helix-turn-helix DNA-binding protein [Thermoanaerobaculia bacterium]|nr:sigma factor-like helix-turn-helix DNA-binding protein [Thermoanaerobaculia bacterium]
MLRSQISPGEPRWQDLEPRDREVLLRRWGRSRETLAAIAAEHGVTREAVRQWEGRALARLRETEELQWVVAMARRRLEAAGFVTVSALVAAAMTEHEERVATVLARVVVAEADFGARPAGLPGVLALDSSWGARAEAVAERVVAAFAADADITVEQLVGRLQRQLDDVPAGLVPAVVAAAEAPLRARARRQRGSQRARLDKLVQHVLSRTDGPLHWQEVAAEVDSLCRSVGIEPFAPRSVRNHLYQLSRIDRAGDGEFRLRRTGARSGGPWRPHEEPAHGATR